jgi:hypothetical protein
VSATSTAVRLRNYPHLAGGTNYSVNGSNAVFSKRLPRSSTIGNVKLGVAVRSLFVTRCVGTVRGLGVFPNSACAVMRKRKLFFIFPKKNTTPMRVTIDLKFEDDQDHERYAWLQDLLEKIAETYKLEVQVQEQVRKEEDRAQKIKDFIAFTENMRKQITHFEIPNREERNAR